MSAEGRSFARREYQQAKSEGESSPYDDWLSKSFVPKLARSKTDPDELDMPLTQKQGYLLTAMRDLLKGRKP